MAISNQEKLNKLNEMKTKTVNALSYLDTASSDLYVAKTNFEEGVIVSGEPYDRGVLENTINQLENIKTDLNSIYNRILSKITQVNEELLEQKVKAAANSNATSASSKAAADSTTSTTSKPRPTANDRRLVK